jgi:hypothetical protein
MSESPVRARPIRVARQHASRRGKQPGDPATTLGVGSVRVFHPLRSSTPPVPARGLRAWHAWLAIFVFGGSSLAGAIAVLRHERAREVPTLPAALPVVQLPTVAPVHESVPPRPSSAIVERRAAVDALLAGRTRAALEQYRALLASSPSDGAAIERVIELLARELHACEQDARTPCGF